MALNLNVGDGDKRSAAAATRDILDLSHATVCSEHELKKLLEKVPDFRIRPEKVRKEDVELNDVTPDVAAYNSGGGTSPSRCAGGGTSRDREFTSSYAFADPMPASMSDVNIRELGRVNISWRMLTMSRPKTKNEEEIFSRLVQLEKLQYQTVKWENDQEALRERKGASFSKGTIPRGRNRGGSVSSSSRSGSTTRATVTEVRLQTCKECGEEFCSGACKKYLYDDHARALNPPSNDEIFKVSVNVARKSTKTVKVVSEDTKKNEEDAPDEDDVDGISPAIETSTPAGGQDEKPTAPAQATINKKADNSISHHRSVNPKSNIQGAKKRRGKKKLN